MTRVRRVGGHICLLCVLHRSQYHFPPTQAVLWTEGIDWFCTAHFPWLSPFLCAKFSVIFLTLCSRPVPTIIKLLLWWQIPIQIACYCASITLWMLSNNIMRLYPAVNSCRRENSSVSLSMPAPCCRNCAKSIDPTSTFYTGVLNTLHEIYRVGLKNNPKITT